MGFLGSIPSSSFAPSLTHCSILAIASIGHACCFPLGHARLFLPLDAQDQVALVRLARNDNRLVVRPLLTPFCSFSNVVRSSLPFRRPTPSPLWQPMQLATRIGAISCENLSWPVSPAPFLVGAALALAGCRLCRSRGLLLGSLWSAASPRHQVVAGELAEWVYIGHVLRRGPGRHSPGSSEDEPGMSGDQQREPDRDKPDRGERAETWSNPATGGSWT